MDQLTCSACGATFTLDDPRWRCDCGGLLDVQIHPQIDPMTISGRRPNLWRYREALPIQDDDSIVSLGEGMTPLLQVYVSGRPVWIKQDHLFPSGSYKDRGATVLVSKIKELGITEVVEDSSGNAGSAIAAYCARAGIHCRILVPEETSPGKLAQIEAYGATLCRVPGDREATARAAWEAAQTTYYASHSWNPFFFQGTKTFAYEVCEQLGWRAPDSVILPVGNGTLLLGCHIGFSELARAGVSSSVPKLIAVQASACAPLAQAFAQRLDHVPSIEKRSTVAEGIAVAEPARGMQVVRAVQETGGTFLTVDDHETAIWLEAMWRQGYYIEPTSAATIAGVAKYVNDLGKDETVVSVFTGHGLKTAGKTLAY